MGRRAPLSDYLRGIWQRREFAITLPLGELRAQNRDTVLGQVWHLLNPLLLIAVYYVVFQVVLGIEERRGVPHYLPFLAVGIIAYNFTRASARSGAGIIVKNRKMVQSINFPRAVLPLSAVVTETISHLYALVVMAGMLMVVGVMPTWRWLLVVPILLVHVALNLGIALTVARLTFHLRDVRQILPYVLHLGRYVSGVLIPINPDLIPQTTLRTILEINPVYNVIEMTRQAFLGYPFQTRVWVVGTAWAAGLLVLGIWYFRRAEHEYGRV